VTLVGICMALLCVQDQHHWAGRAEGALTARPWFRYTPSRAPSDSREDVDVNMPNPLLSHSTRAYASNTRNRTG
jgi:hypothetical protein